MGAIYTIFAPMSINISEYEAVIFDMDGVLIDSEPLWKIAMENAFKKVGCNLTRKDFQKTVGLRIDEVINYWYHETGWKGYSPKQVEELIVDGMIELIKSNPTPLPGVLDTLSFLQKSGLKIGLATSSYTILIDTVLNELDLAHSFMVTHSAEHEQFGKPHPSVYLTVANELDVNPSKCLVIEDSLNGIISGKAARMKVVCIPEKTHYPEPKLMVADYIYESMTEMLKDLKND